MKQIDANELRIGNLALYGATVSTLNAIDIQKIVNGENMALWFPIEITLDWLRERIAELESLVSSLAEYCPAYEEGYWTKIRKALNK